MRLSSLTREDGFTVVETMVAALILVVGVFGSIALVDGANATTVNTRAREAATNLAREVVEDARSVNYEEIAGATLEQRLRARPGLDASPGMTGWRVARRGFTYTVAVSSCAVDDSKDGAGSHATGGFCSESAAAGTGDSDPEDYKRVTVEVTWTLRTATKTVRQSSIVPNPGNAAGVAVESISGPSTVTGDEATYSVTTSREAASIEWFVDGASRGTVDGPSTSFGFSWPVDLCDGVHYVTVQAYDAFGRTAGTRSVTVTLDRGVACPADSETGGGDPGGGSGGTNTPPTKPTLDFSVAGSKVKLDWTASTDPDPGDSVTLYRIYRDGAPYATSTTTGYTDHNAKGQPHSYHVTAIDSKGAESAASNTINYFPKGYTP